jgi:hypothetical protein
LLATALHLPPAFSQSARVVNCAIASAEVPDDTPSEVPLLPVDGLADGAVVALSPGELVDGAEAPVLVELSVEVEVLPVAPVVPEVPVLPASELPVVPAAPLEPLVPAAPAAPDAPPAPPLPPVLV